MASFQPTALPQFGMTVNYRPLPTGTVTRMSSSSSIARYPSYWPSLIASLNPPA